MGVIGEHIQGTVVNWLLYTTKYTIFFFWKKQSFFMFFFLFFKKKKKKKKNNVNTFYPHRCFGQRTLTWEVFFIFLFKKYYSTYK